MENITCLYYTANRIKESAGEKIRQHLLKQSYGMPIISVSQKSIRFGTNVSIGDIGVSKYNIYKQIYIGLKYVKTRYVACCEDDVLYNLEHFSFKPEKGIFAYDCNMWFAEPDEYWRRPAGTGLDALRRRSGMFGCIAETETLFRFLNEKFRKYPEPNSDDYDWGEPKSKVVYCFGALPLIVFIHHESEKGKRQMQKRKLLERHKRESLPEDHVKKVCPYGNIKEVWKKYYG